MGSRDRGLVGAGLLLLVALSGAAADDPPLHRLSESEIRLVLHDVGIEPVDIQFADHYEVFWADGRMTVQGRARIDLKYEVHDGAVWITNRDNSHECRAIGRDVAGDLYFTSCGAPPRKGMRFRTVPARR